MKWVDVYCSFFSGEGYFFKALSLAFFLLLLVLGAWSGHIWLRSWRAKLTLMLTWLAKCIHQLWGTQSYMHVINLLGGLLLPTGQQRILFYQVKIPDTVKTPQTRLWGLVHWLQLATVKLWRQLLSLWLMSHVFRLQYNINKWGM